MVLNRAFSAKNGDSIDIGNVIPLVHPSLGPNEQEDVADFMPMLTDKLKFDQTNIFPQHSVTKYKCGTCAHESQLVDRVSPLTIVNINKKNPNLINQYNKSILNELDKNCPICRTSTLHTKNEVTQSSYVMIRTATIKLNKEVDMDAHVPGIGQLSLQGFITRHGLTDDSGHFFYNHLTSGGSVILDDQKPNKIVEDHQTTQQNIRDGYIYLYKVTNNTIGVSNPATSIPSSPPHIQIPLAHPTVQVHTTPITQPPFRINTPISTTQPRPTVINTIPSKKEYIKDGGPLAFLKSKSNIRDTFDPSRSRRNAQTPSGDSSVRQQCISQVPVHAYHNPNVNKELLKDGGDAQPNHEFQHIREAFNSSSAHIPEFTVLMKLNINEIRLLLPGRGPKKNKTKKALINELLRHKLKEGFSTFSDFQAAPSEIGILDATNITGLLNAKRPREKDNVILIERINQLR